MKKTAFTIIEVMLSTVILLMLVMVLTVILRQGNNIYNAIQTSVELRQNVRNAMERIVRETRESNNSAVVVNSPDNCTIAFTSPRFAQPIIYFLNSGRVIREYPTNVFNAVAHDVTRLVFAKAGPQLTVIVAAAKTVDGKLYTFSMAQKVRVRNEQ